jgi:hypothetical protein
MRQEIKFYTVVFFYISHHITHIAYILITQGPLSNLIMIRNDVMCLE